MTDKRVPALPSDEEIPVVSLSPEQRIEIAEGELQQAKHEAKLEALRDEVHAARDSGEIPPALKKRWKAANSALRDHRSEHRQKQIDLGIRNEVTTVVVTTSEA